MPFLPWPKNRHERKYVDLIKEAGTKWPNWEAEKKIIQAGDIGTVDRTTGEWKSEGSIFSHQDTASIAKKYSLVTKDEPEVCEIHSYETRGASPLVEFATDADPALVFRLRFKFNAKRGAIMVMHRPQSTTVPREFFEEILKLRLASLKGKSVVYQAFNCHGFFMYLSDKASEEVTVSLRANIASQAGGGGTVTPSWHHEGTTGINQEGYRASGTYSPLYCLRTITKPLLRRDEMDPVAALTRVTWEETDVPWDDIDDDGVTEPEDEFPGPDEDEEF